MERATMTDCIHKHARPQVADADWRCPKCGADIDSGRFVIEDGVSDGCPLLHTDDPIACQCGYDTTGKKFAALVAKRKALVKCEHCRGTGYVPGGGGP